MIRQAQPFDPALGPERLHQRQAVLYRLDQQGSARFAVLHLHRVRIRNLRPAPSTQYVCPYPSNLKYQYARLTPRTTEWEDVSVVLNKADESFKHTGAWAHGATGGVMSSPDGGKSWNFTTLSVPAQKAEQ